MQHTSESPAGSICLYQGANSHLLSASVCKLVQAPICWLRLSVSMCRLRPAVCICLCDCAGSDLLAASVPECRLWPAASVCAVVQAVICCFQLSVPMRPAVCICLCGSAGSDPLSPSANKRRRTQFTSTGPSSFSTSRFSRPRRASDNRQPSRGESLLTCWLQCVYVDWSSF